jgi:Zn finger protein HypA/HybF involved in hydrogenase expression
MLPLGLLAQVRAALGRLQHQTYCHGCRWRLHPGAEAFPCWNLIPVGHAREAWNRGGSGVPRQEAGSERDLPHEAWHCTCERCGATYPMDAALGEELSGAVRRALGIR